MKLLAIDVKSAKRLLVILSILTFLLNISFSWLSGWQYRIPILINNTLNSNNLTDYQVLITLDTQSLISAGKMRNDCGDIRFTDSDGITLLNYWIESGCNSANTRIWVKVNISRNSNKTIYIYYGNHNATSLSNISAFYRDITIYINSTTQNDFIIANKGGSYSFGSYLTMSIPDAQNVGINFYYKYPIRFANNVNNMLSITARVYSVTGNYMHRGFGLFTRTDIAGWGWGVDQGLIPLQYGFRFHSQSGSSDSAFNTYRINITFSSNSRTITLSNLVDTGNFVDLHFAIMNGNSDIWYASLPQTYTWNQSIEKFYFVFGMSSETTSYYDGGTIYVSSFSISGVFQILPLNEPTISLGNEELEVRVSVNIISPQNQTYYSSLINFSFQVNISSPFILNITINSYLDSNLQTSESFTNIYNFNYSKSFSLNLTVEKFYNFTVEVLTNYGSKIQSVVFTLKLYDFSVSFSNFTVYNNVKYVNTLRYTINYRCGVLGYSTKISLLENNTETKYYNITCNNATNTINDIYQASSENTKNITLILYAYDSKDNKAVSDIFLFDYTAPNFSFSFNPALLFRFNNTESVTYFARDNFSYAICNISFNNNATNVILQNNQTTLTANLIDGKNTITIECKDIVNNTNKIEKTYELYVKKYNLYEEVRNRLLNNFTNFFSLIVRSEATNSQVDLKALQRNFVYYVNYRNASDTIRFDYSYSNTYDTIIRLFDVDLSDTETNVCIHEEVTQYFSIYLIASSEQAVAVKNAVVNCYVTTSRTRYLLQNALALKIYTIKSNYYLYKFENSNKVFLALLDGSITQAINLDMLQYFRKETALKLFAEDLSIEKISSTTLKIYYKNDAKTNNYAILRIYDSNRKIFEHYEATNPNEFSLYFDFSTINLSSNILRFEVESNNGKFVRFFDKEGRIGILSDALAVALAFLIYFLFATISIRFSLGMLGIVAALIALIITTLAIQTAIVFFAQVVFIILIVFHFIMIKEQTTLVT